MLAINLLPWRAYRQGRINRYYRVAIAGVILIGIFAVVITQRYYLKQYTQQQYRNDLLQYERNILQGQIILQDKQLQIRENLLKQLTTFNSAMENQALITDIMNKLQVVLPQGSYYTQVFQKGHLLHILGVTNSKQMFAILLRNIKRIGWIVQSQHYQQMVNPSDQNDTIKFEMQIFNSEKVLFIPDK